MLVIVIRKAKAEVDKTAHDFAILASSLKEVTCRRSERDCVAITAEFGGSIKKTLYLLVNNDFSSSLANGAK
jgi:hypothetical protein